VSVFHPDRLQLVKGSPAHRRAHLDRLCGAIWPARADLRNRFGRTLAQRNALVQRIRAGLGEPDSLPSWDERLAAEAEPLMEARSEAVDVLAETFSELASGLGLPEAEISYRPRAAGATSWRRSSPPAHRGPGPCLHLLRAAARRGGASSRRQGPPPVRLPGPAAPRPPGPALRRAGGPDGGGSGGPLMLLDDVMSELDPGHRELLSSLSARDRRPGCDHGDRVRPCAVSRGGPDPVTAGVVGPSARLRAA
jgi:DNA replication and repair protein RecF